MTYHARLTSLITQRGRLCVGIDPMPSVLAAWDLPVTVDGLERCARGIVEELATTVAVFKPQSAFFERFGSAGIAVLERVLADISDAGAVSLLDVKRGDIGSTMRGYAEAYLTDTTLAADAITVSPFLGPRVLHETYEIAASNDRGVYVLARTSNPEGVEVQQAVWNVNSVTQLVVDDAAQQNKSVNNCVGLVIGATSYELGCDLSQFHGSILAPGIGAQGATITDLAEIFGNNFDKVLPTASRSVIGFGKSSVANRAQELLDELA